MSHPSAHHARPQPKFPIGFVSGSVQHEYERSVAQPELSPRREWTRGDQIRSDLDTVVRCYVATVGPVVRHADRAVATIRNWLNAPASPPD